MYTAEQIEAERQAAALEVVAAREAVHVFKTTEAEAQDQTGRANKAGRLGRFSLGGEVDRRARSVHAAGWPCVVPGGACRRARVGGALFAVKVRPDLP